MQSAPYPSSDGSLAPPSYTPLVHELNYYNGLFQVADISQSGEVNGRDSVAFLSKSKLPVDLLKNIWNMVDQNPKTNTLNPSKFFTAVRLIQLYQNGQKPNGPTLQCADGNPVMRPPFFEGVTGVMVQPFAIVSPSMAGNTSTDAAATNFNAPPMSSNAMMNTNTPSSFSSPPRDSATTAVPQTQPNSTTVTTALTQDPYMMLPGEQVRYESLFPQYEKDGFVHGSEAVALFTKSGLGKEILRDLWNMVDDPVDNQLSKLEFAIAMHLIVCISKKNLPVPPSLPLSLKLLKEREAASTNMHISGNKSMNGYNTMGGGMDAVGGAANLSAPPSPPAPQRMTLAPVVSLPMAAPTGMNMNNAMYNTNPLDQHRMSISDAFSNLPAPSSASVKSADSTASPSSNRPPSTVPLHSIQTSASKDHSSEEELRKIQSVLQKLQAENVSLKAQLGQYSDEEKHVRDEISRTVAEIGALSQELTSLRSQVVSSKASLIEASAELKALIEKRDLQKSIVGETVAMIDALEMGKDSIDAARNIALESKTRKANQGPTYTGNTYGYPDMDGLSVGSASVRSSQLVPGNNIQQQHYVGHSNVQPPLHYSPTPSHAPVAPPPPPKIHEPTPEVYQQLQRMKQEAEHTEKELQSARDYAQALSIQFSDVKVEAERLYHEAEEKTNEASKKKGKFRGGNKKAAKKEAEDAKQKAMFKGDEVQQLQYRLQQAEDQVAQLKHKAETLRTNADSFEMELSNQITQARNQYQIPYQEQPMGYAAVDPFTSYDTSVQRNTTQYRQESVPVSGYAGPSITLSRPSQSGMYMGGYSTTTSHYDDNSSIAHSSIYDQYNESGSVAYDAPSLSAVESMGGSEDVFGHQTHANYNLMGGTAGSLGSTSRLHGDFDSDAGYQSMHSTGISQSGSYVFPGANAVYQGDNSVSGSLSYTDVSTSGFQDSGWSYGGSIGKPPSPVPENSVLPEKNDSYITDYLPRIEHTHTGYDSSSSIQGSFSRGGTIHSISAMDESAKEDLFGGIPSPGSSVHTGTTQHAEESSLGKPLGADVGLSLQMPTSSKEGKSDVWGIPSPNASTEDYMNAFLQQG